MRQDQHAQKAGGGADSGAPADQCAGGLAETGAHKQDLFQIIGFDDMVLLIKEFQECGGSQVWADYCD